MSQLTLLIELKDSIQASLLLATKLNTIYCMDNELLIEKLKYEISMLKGDINNTKINEVK